MGKKSERYTKTTDMMSQDGIMMIFLSFNFFSNFSVRICYFYGFKR